MARLWRDQGQVNPDGEPKVDRNGISIWFYFGQTNIFLFSANGTVQDCGTGDENQSIQQGGLVETFARFQQIQNPNLKQKTKLAF